MDPLNFLREADRIVTGDGFRRDLLIPLDGMLVFTTGQPISTGTANLFMTRSEVTGIVAQWAAASVAAAMIQVGVPGDYDFSKDELKLRILGSMAGATDTPTITANIYRKRAGIAQTVDLGPKTSGAFGGTLGSIVIMDLSSLGCSANDALSIKLTPAAHGTDAINIFDIRFRYKSDMVLFDYADR